MGKRRFASTSAAESAATTNSRYGSNHVTAHCRGWDVGVYVHAYIDDNGNDQFDIWTTGGSNDTQTKKLIATVYADGSFSN